MILKMTLMYCTCKQWGTGRLLYIAMHLRQVKKLLFSTFSGTRAYDKLISI